MFITTVTSKGQATIPLFIRLKLGLKPGEKIMFEERGKDVILKKSPNFLDLMGSLKTKKKYNKKVAYKAIGKMLAEKQRRINEQAN
ncbi:MAG: AbrB/MazE/SpoVT family DNA-binding domain-containing protein [Candidatus Daviesbacteria bacterium]|nr:AbrB/MazE/SpoVT family DNA-binding domain-containing protein [Candidatus Daviesbacteria bacterium]